MGSVKEQMTKIIQEQPDDSSYDEILRELTFARMIERGLKDSKKDRTIGTMTWSVVSGHGKNKLREIRVRRPHYGSQIYPTSPTGRLTIRHRFLLQGLAEIGPVQPSH